MSEDGWAALTARDTVVLVAVLAVYLGGIVGIARNLPRLLMRDQAWRRDTERYPASIALTLAVLIVSWQVSIPYLAWRMAVRRRGRSD
ncbi:hypothetical protein [Streptomyces sp. HC307]|uniref:hypothetical protein n=1 Tax=Streptomyces flavusporus TaxID=3385496 RepID=UPI00391730D5